MQNAMSEFAIQEDMLRDTLLNQGEAKQPLEPQLIFWDFLKDVSSIWVSPVFRVIKVLRKSPGHWFQDLLELLQWDIICFLPLIAGSLSPTTMLPKLASLLTHTHKDSPSLLSLPVRSSIHQSNSFTQEVFLFSCSQPCFWRTCIHPLQHSSGVSCPIMPHQCHNLSQNTALSRSSSSAKHNRAEGTACRHQGERRQAERGQRQSGFGAQLRAHWK